MVELINIMKLLVFVALLGYALASELEHNFGRGANTIIRIYIYFIFQM